MDFQEVIMRLDRFWAEKGCLVWQPYNVQVGAGTWNPATALRALGPEPWNVGYVETSVRPADGRYGENPNRWGQYYQYQVILKPDPGNPVEVYLESLAALGINVREHDIRFVEDNWESPGLGAWGLGWEVWMDGQEITQYTYFQQAGGFELDPVSVEITYGLERIVMVLQGARDFVHMNWGHGITYGDMLLRQEIEHCTYSFEKASVERLTQMYDLFEAEARSALSAGLAIPAHDYVLKCSHTFNILDARGAIGVTERARYFARMRHLSHEVATLYLKQREEMGFPLLKPLAERSDGPSLSPADRKYPSGPADLLLEVGTGELPAADLDSGMEQLRENAAKMLEKARLGFEQVQVFGTPRRLVLHTRGLTARQRDREHVVKGPPAHAAFDKQGQPTRAALGFARAQGVEVEALQKREYEGKSYVVATKVEPGRAAAQVLEDVLPDLIASLRFVKSMRWNSSGVTFSRPIRWLVALLGDRIIPFEYAGVRSGRVTRGLRPLGSPDIELRDAATYLESMQADSIMVDADRRQEAIAVQAAELAASVDGYVPDDPVLLQEVTGLVEWPRALMGQFGEQYLELPQEVLIAVMKKHQRYFPVMKDGQLLSYFVAVANGPFENLDVIRHGNEEVLRARYADAAFFYQADTGKELEDFLPRLDTLTFEEHLGSVLDKAARLENLVPQLADLIGVTETDQQIAVRAAHLCKADLATQMVVELTSLQGIMGQKYALLSGEEPDVARAICEHYLPRGSGDDLPRTIAGQLIGLADRMDSLVGLFAVGLSPTGSSDPYGLRRAALGLVQILAKREISISLREAFRAAAALLPVEVSESELDAVHRFVAQRFRGWLLDLGYRYDLVDAALAEHVDNPYHALVTVRSLGEWVAHPEFASLLTAYSRPSRIVREYTTRFALDPEAFTKVAEKELHSAVQVAQGQRASVRDVDGLMAVLRPLARPIATFFDQVFVMAEDQDVRENRLALLQRIAELPKGIVDLTKVLGY
ncbi:MAG TPA: glycine--tRNA ligase subunit beta [Anaerolineae bacterium]|nr:glycine--tRNA ligase subunit beta [Anaerolineae bacterium]